MGLVKLTSSDLRSIVAEAVLRLVNEGYMGHNGNSMVGGYWDSWTEEGTVNIMDMVLENTYDDTDEIDSKWNEITKILNDNYSLFDVTAKFEVGYDETVGMGSKSSPYVGLEEITEFNKPALMQLVNSLPLSDASKKSLVDSIEKCVDEIEDGKHNDMFDIDGGTSDDWYDYDD